MNVHVSKVRQSDWEHACEYTIMARQQRLPTTKAEYTFAVVSTARKQFVSMYEAIHMWTF